MANSEKTRGGRGDSGHTIYTHYLNVQGRKNPQKKETESNGLILSERRGMPGAPIYHIAKQAAACMPCCSCVCVCVDISLFVVSFGNQSKSFIRAHKKSVCLSPAAELINPLVPDAHYSERQDRPFSLPIQRLEVDSKLNCGFLFFAPWTLMG